MDYVARVIHELDQEGNVIRIGFEPAGWVADRQSGIKAVVRLINCTSALLDLIHLQTGFQAVLDSREASVIVEALADLRQLMPAMHRSCSQGMSLPTWQTAPESKRYHRRAA